MNQRSLGRSAPVFFGVLFFVFVLSPESLRGDDVDLTGDWNGTSGEEFGGGSSELRDAAARLVLQHRNGTITGTIALASKEFGAAHTLTTATFSGRTLTLTAQGKSCTLTALLTLETGTVVDSLTGRAFCGRSFDLLLYRPGTKKPDGSPDERRTT